MILRDKCFEHFKLQETVTADQIYKWYCINKTNPDKLPQRIAVYTSIINPLCHEGKLTKISRGVYRINLVQEEQSQGDKEWEEYIQRKIRESKEKEK
jgi:hypothetical protein